MTGILTTTQYVGSGPGGSGSDSLTSIGTGGVQYIGYNYGTGTATDTTIGGISFVTPFALQYVGDDYGTGAVSGTVINVAGAQIVGGDHGTGTATDTNIMGTQIVGSAYGIGTAIDTTINGGAQQLGVDFGTGTATSTTINGGEQFVGSGTGGTGTAIDTVISGGTQFIGAEYATGLASGATILNGGEQDVGSIGYGSAVDTTIGNDSYADSVQVVGAGGEGSATATSTTINAQGVQTVGSYALGSAVDTVINSGGEQILGVGDSQIIDGKTSIGGQGVAVNTTINQGGRQFVGDNDVMAFASNTTVGGLQIVGYGSGTGSAVSTTILAGGVQWLGWDSATNAPVGAATSTTIQSGGSQVIGFAAGALGSALDTLIEAGGWQEVGDAGTGTAAATTIIGGSQLVTKNGQASSTVISGGSQTIEAGGQAFSTIINAGAQYVDGGATASDTTILGGQQDVAGSAQGTTIGNGGLQLINDNGSATGTLIDTGGMAEILQGVIDAPVIDGGTLVLAAGGTLGADPLTFAADQSWGTLDLTGDGSGVDLTTKIYGFAGLGGTAGSSDIIDVTGTGQAGDQAILVGHSTLDVEDSNGDILAQLALHGLFTQDQFVLTQNGQVDEIGVYCFLAGTRIRTPAGEVPVEALQRGDLVLTPEHLALPISWLGRQSIALRFADPLRVLPIRIRAGALADHVPQRDLLLSPDHALLVDNLLVQAGALVNGVSIVRETRMPESFVYYHIELSEHGLVLAEGTPAETFVDHQGRLNFDNWAEFIALYPQGRAVAELPWPRAKSWRQLPAALREKLRGRAQAVAPARRTG